ncbi:carboxylesterase/lipase family protein [Streptomyces hygroscopicus]|uniref:carboxylesterase/lipase family protein n=1 Tax=Streptomyces TaxID=1883 RepID=UPI00099F9718|nr:MULTISPECIES: carboxylesterase/lipase family protein [unclassified Streptomyces]MCO8308337.1 carboxylesterase family protein [Streptomyces sp. RKCA744]
MKDIETDIGGGSPGRRRRARGRRRPGVRAAWRIGVAAITAMLAALGPAPTATATEPVVTVAQGRLQGTERHGVAEFLGIPYAAPPVGPLRWKPPRPAPPWRGTRVATKTGNWCPQPDAPARTDEDCLYLNVYAPATRTARLRPVMVWIHGGSFNFGSGSAYDPSRLAARGFVVVTINFRIGPLGYLALPSLAAEARDHTSGAYGLMDQQAALRWVRANAAAFGGDRHNTTVFGESSGGMSICAQTVSPTAAGLFQRAIVQSGCLLTQPTQTQANARGTSFAAEQGCPDAVTAARCLRAKPARELVRNVNVIDGWAPPVGGTIQPRQVRDALADDAYHHVPVLQGTDRDEGNYFSFLDYPDGLPVARYREAVTRHFGPEAAARIAAEYPPSAYPSPRWALGAAIGDAWYACPAYQSDGMFGASTPTYAFEFDDPHPAGLDYDTPGAVHAAELAYLFRPFGPEPTIPGQRPFSPAQRALSEKMISYWTRFAATGDPNAPGLPAWPAFTPRTPAVQELTPNGIGPSTDFAARHKCAFWLPLLDSGKLDLRL